MLRPGCASADEAEAIAARIVDLSGRTYVLEGHMLNIGASVGVALAPADGSDADTLLKHADLALYGAKSAGRGRFSFFEPSMDARMQERRALEIDLRRALALKEFELVYQPQIGLSSDTIVGFEALIRWNNPRRGVVSPADFIPIAEETGLIVQIGEWVLRTACREAAGWSRPVSIAVNLSPLQFRSAQLLETVTSAIAHAGLDPQRLELEITEGVLMDDTDRVVTMLHSLRSLGVRVSMDDFGTGYSSLSYLQKFPFDKIKIDQSFVRGMKDNPECGAIVRAVASIGASLGMKTTAEGVETQEQLDAIRAEGCCEVQGYWTGRPMPASDAGALLIQPTQSTQGA
jgi:predicted signal transduction protein with EAL and GGDEF domain